MFSNIVLAEGTNGANNNFGELQGATISGSTYIDANNDGIFQGGETAQPGVTITLTGTDDLGNAVSATTTSNASGAYSFANLRPGTYAVTETQPAGLLDGRDTAGTLGGSTAVNDTISAITIGSGQTTSGNNFGELQGATISGSTYLDANNDGIFQVGETAQPGVTITLTGTNDLGNAVSATTTSAADGSYSFGTLRPGTYAVTETQPAGLLDGKDTAGTLGGSTAVNDTIRAITIGSGQTTSGNNFAELRPASLSGAVFDDTNNNGVFDGGETGILGATITLTGTDDLGNAVNVTTTTGAGGLYTFGTLRPGNYTISETQPVGFLDGKDTIGTPGGTSGNDVFSNIVLTEGTNGSNNTFGEHVASALTGSVFVDLNANGVRDAFESGMAGVTVTLTGTDDVGGAVSITTTTDANGNYIFNGLRPSNASGYAITETQPAGYGDGAETVGSQGGTLPVNDTIQTAPIFSGTVGSGNNFGELFTAALNKSVVSSSLAATTGNSLAIGEVVRFRLQATVPTGTLSDFQLIDLLPPGFRFLNDSTATFNAALLGDNAISASATLNDDTYASGTDVYFKLGTITTAGASGTVVVEFNAIVVNELANQAGATLANTFAQQYDIDGDGVADPVVGGSNTITATVVEPSISVNKVVSTAGQDAGDTVVYTVQITNAAGSNSATAFALNLRDLLDANLSFVSVSAAGANIIANGSTGSMLDVTLDQLDPGSTVTLTINAVVRAGAPAGATIANNAGLTYASTPTPGGDTRDGSGGLNDYTLTATSGNFTLAQPQVDKLTPADTTYSIGEVVTYDILVTLPEGVTQSLSITDALPAGLVFDSAQVVPGGFNGTVNGAPVQSIAGSNYTFTFGDTTTAGDNNAANNSFILRLTAHVDNIAANQTGTTLVNNATLDYTDATLGARTVLDATPNVTVSVVEPILSLDKQVTFGPGAPKAGDTITYTVTITHAAGSGSTAWDALLADSVPVGLQITGIVSTTLTGGAQVGTPAAITGGGTGLSGMFDVPVGGSVVVTYTAVLTSDAVLGSTLTNVADLTWTSLSGASPIERSAGDSLLGAGGLNDYELMDSAPVLVNGGATDFTLDKQLLGDTNAEIGERLNYSITLTVADGILNNLTLADVIPAGFQLVAGSALVTGSSGVTLTGASFLYAANQLNFSLAQAQGAVDGLTNRITITYQVDVLDSALNDAFGGATLKTNTATASYDPGTGPITRSDTATATIVEPVIAVDKTVVSAPSPLRSGSTITYQVVISHAANSTGGAFNIDFADVLAAGLGNVVLTGVSGTAAALPAPGDFLVAGNSITTLAPFDLALGETVILTYTADVQIFATPGQLLTNAANVTAESTNTNASGNTRTSGSTTNGGNYDASDSVSLTADPNISLTKTANVTQAVVGDRVTYTLVISVIEGTIPGLMLTDILPTGPQLDLSTLTYSFGAPGMSAANPSPLSFAGGVITGNFGDLSNPADADSTNDFLTITYETVIADNGDNTPGSLKQNVASATYTGLPTPVTDDATVTVTEPELNVVKTASDSTPHVGDIVIFTLTITHTGASTADAFDIAIADALPPGLTLDASSIVLRGAPAGTNIASNSSSNGGALGLMLNQVALGGTVIVEYRATVTSNFALIGGTYGGGDDSFTNTVNLTYDTKSGTPPDGERVKADSASAIVTVVGGDLAVTKDNGLANVTPGQTVTYTLTVTNNGTDAATNVVVTDTLPLAGVTFVNAPGGTYNAGAGTVTFNIASLGIGQTQTFAVTVTINSSVPAGLTQIVNTTTVTHDDPDPTPGDNTDDDTDPVVAAPDYVITKTDGVTSAKPGNTLTYTITVRNAGNQSGTGVVVSDTFTTGMFSSVTASNGGVVDLVAGTVSWNLGTLAGGQTATLTLTCVINSTFTDIDPAPDNNAITDTVTVTDDGTNGPDPTPLNNTATDQDDLLGKPDLKVVKTDGVLVAQAGQILTYRITATNNGAQNSNGTIVSDVLPAGVTFLSAGSNDPALTGSATFVNGRVVWTFAAPFAAGDSVVLTVRVQVNAGVAGVSLSNVVTIRDDHRYGPDRTPDDNSDTDTNTVPPIPVPFTPPPFFFAFDTFHNFSNEGRAPGVLPTLGPIDIYRLPMLPLMPIYSGESDPGATLVLELYNANGERIGSQTVVVDAGGNWLATFPSTVARDYPNSVSITQLSAPYSVGAGGGYNLRTYYSPALNAGQFMFSAVHTSDLFGTDSAPLLSGLLLENPISLGTVKYGGEFLSSQAMAGGY